jgi:hypothetical protein
MGRRGWVGWDSNLKKSKKGVVSRITNKNLKEELNHDV